MAEGDASKVAITVDNLDIRSGGVIGSDTAGQGNAGDVMIIANELTIDRHGSDPSSRRASVPPTDYAQLRHSPIRSSR